MGSGAWLRLLLTLGALWGLGAREKLRGRLGEATILSIPPEFQVRTRQSGEASWKRFPEGQRTKKFLLKLSGGNHTELEPGRMRFHRHDFSLEILNTSREDGQIYEYSVSKGQEEDVWQVQLEVLEPVSHPSIRILGWELSNGSCSLALLCTAERGDQVSYSWESRGDQDGSGSGICSGRGAELNLSFPLPSAAPGCVCTASNPVSHGSAALQPHQCGPRHRGGPGLRTELLVPLVASIGVIIIIIIIVVVIVTFRATHLAKGDQDPSPATPDSAGATIYAQVQKPKGIVPKATTTPLPSTTIYAAATGPPPAPDGVPHSPAVSPSPGGLPPLSQEPTTVYASVTLPVA